MEDIEDMEDWELQVKRIIMDAINEQAIRPVGAKSAYLAVKMIDNNLFLKVTDSDLDEIKEFEIVVNEVKELSNS